MVRLTRIIVALSGAILIASPAPAEDCGPLGRCPPTKVPEPSNIGIFALGLAGLLIRQQISRRRARSGANSGYGQDQRGAR
jgi:hypothetical protein